MDRRQKVLCKKFRSEEAVSGQSRPVTAHPLTKWRSSIRHSVHCMSQMDKLLPGRVIVAPGDTVQPYDQRPSVDNKAVPSTSSPKSTITIVAADICRICHCEATADAPLIAPCYCSGSLKYVHQRCLQQWIKSSQTKACEVCRFSFIMQTKVKPFRKWEKLDISSVERRKIFCSVAFHFIAITCVVWSLYVLMDRTAEEIREGHIDWPFWTKLVVVAIGFSGGVVFMYVQCKMYVQLFRRWKAYNKVIYVGNCPDFPKQTLVECYKTTEQK